ncbi:hypothetical protein RND81_02G149500 [Saponaria officinalis]|uniref:DNA repair metallo-beta-lactamase domain-containing protein n=1 Tax=Saponaria officinalis TaxID=3572 RepID=A0AAW1MN00_SAPOF
MPIDMPRKLPFSVDTWNPNSKIKRHHFLTHAHKDHCSGITTHFSYPIYSTHLTKLIILQFFPQLDESLFVGIEVEMCLTIEDPDGSFKVTAFDANHCPGAVMFLFEGDFGNILHTGDCRLTPECLMYLPEKNLSKNSKEPNCPLDFLFLDCTFGKSLMKIPSKQSAIQQITNCIWKHPNVPTVYLTCNLLGQEEILVHVSETFGSKIFVDKTIHPDFYKILQLIAPQIISDDPSSRFHLFEGFPKLYEKAQRKILEARENMQPEPLIIRPSAQWYAHEETGLTMMERKIIEKSNIPVKDHFGVWHVCYSMHSSRQELDWALELLAPKWVVSTTPECRAMELNYVKTRCFNSHTSNAHVWKLLGLSVDASLDANISSDVSIDASVEVMTIAALEESQSESPKKLAYKRVLSLSPLRKKSSITLFGRARLGYHSCIADEVLKSTSGSLYDQKQAISDKVEQKLPFLDDNVGCEVEKPTEFKNNDVEQKLLQSEKTESEKPIEFKNNNVEQKMLHSDDIVVEKPVEDNIAVVDPKTDSYMCRRDTTICETVSYPSCSSYTSYSSRTSIGSVNGYSDNVRKLYRSMNVAVPKPLPSLVELMKARKRAKR